MAEYREDSATSKRSAGAGKWTSNALKDIDDVLGTLKAPDGTSAVVAILTERITRLHACILRCAPPNSPYRAKIDEFGQMSLARGGQRPPGGGINSSLVC